MDYPLINGVRHEWSSIEIKLNGVIFIGVKEVAYSDSLEPTKVYGVHPQPIGRTRGVYEAEGSFTLYLEEANDLIAALGDGFKEVPFDVIVAYSEGGKTITDEIIGCRIKSNDQGNSQGADPLERKFELDVMLVRWDGKESLKSPLAGVGA